MAPDRIGGALRNGPGLAGLLLAAAAFLLPISASFGTPSDPAAPAQTGEAPPEMVLQTGHTHVSVNALAWSPNGSLLASSGIDPKLRLWDLQEGSIREELAAHDHPVTCLDWSSGGEYLASGDAGGTIRIWSISAKRPVQALAGPVGAVQSVRWSPDGKRLAGGGADGRARIWEPAAGTAPLLSLEHTAAVGGVAWSPEGRRLATVSEEQALKIWDATTGACLRSIPLSGTAEWAVTWSPDGKQLATAERRGVIYLWDSGTGEPAGTTDCGERVLSLAWGGEPARLLAGCWSGAIRVWNPTTNENLRLTGHRARVPGVAWKPGASSFASCAWDGTVRLWDDAGGASVRTLQGGHVAVVRTVEWSADGKALASGSRDGIVRVWNTETGEATHALRGHGGPISGVGWQDAGRRLISSSDDHTIRSWDLARGAADRMLEGHDNWVNSMSLDRAGKLLVSGSHDPTGKPEGRAQVQSTGTGQVITRVSTFPVFAVAMSPDGSCFATGGRGGLSIWDTAAGKRLAQGGARHEEVAALAWSPDGRILASRWSDKTIRLWDAAGEEPREIARESLDVTVLRWSPDGALLALARREGVILLWDPVKREVSRQLEGHSGWIHELSWHPDGKALASAGQDGTARIWPLAGDGRVRSVALVGADHDGRSAWLAVTPEGYYDGTPEAAGLIRWRIGAEIFPAARYAARFHRPGMVRKALAGEPPPRVSLGRNDVPPAARILTPQTGTATQAPQVEVEIFGGDDRGVADAELFVNGRPLAPEAARPLSMSEADSVAYGPPTADGNRPVLIGARPLVVGSKAIVVGSKSISEQHRVGRTFRFRVPLPPGSEPVNLRAVVYDDQGYNSEPADIVLHRAGAPAVKGQLYALSIGVSRYRNPAFNLRFAATDAKDMAEILSGQKTLYQEAQVISLLNEEATVAKIGAALARLQEEVTPSDTVILFLSGHGIEDREGQYYFATHEVDPANLPGTALSVPQLQELLGPRLRAKSVFLFADTCHSGKIPVRRGSNDRFSALRTVVLASSQGGELAFERDEWGHGAFTLALLEALRGKAEPSSPVVRFDALAFYVRRRVEELLGAAQQVTISAAGFPFGTPVAQL